MEIVDRSGGGGVGGDSARRAIRRDRRADQGGHSQPPSHRPARPKWQTGDAARRYDVGKNHRHYGEIDSYYYTYMYVRVPTYNIIRTHIRVYIRGRACVPTACLVIYEHEYRDVLI